MPTVRSRRDISTFFMNEDDKKYILNDVSLFIDNEKWYKDRGLHHVRGYLFHGPPGTGKTTLSELLVPPGWSYCKVIAENISGDNFLNNFQEKNTVFVFEDIDVINSSKSRDERGNDKTNEELGLQTLLSILDGSYSTGSNIFILTTNYVDRLDKALIRSGRVDVTMELGPISEDVGLKMCKSFLGDIEGEKFSHSVRYPIVPSDLQRDLMNKRNMILSSEIAKGEQE